MDKDIPKHIQNLYDNVGNILSEYNEKAGTNFVDLNEVVKHVMAEIHDKNDSLNIFNLIEVAQAIDSFQVIDMSSMKEQYPDKFNESGGMDWKWFEAEIRPNNFIYYRPDKNSISFTMQSSETKVDGCSVSAVIETAKLMLEAINYSSKHCRDISQAVTKLDEALLWIDKRRKAFDKNKLPICQL